jgi:hypothetical protein
MLVVYRFEWRRKADANQERGDDVDGAEGETDGGDRDRRLCD